MVKQCYVKPTKDPLGVSHSKRNQGTIRGTVTLPNELRGRTSDKVGDDLGGESRRRESNGRSNPEVEGSIPTEVKIIFSLPRVVP